jgi:hypothetical protein
MGETVRGHTQGTWIFLYLRTVYITTNGTRSIPFTWYNWQIKL